MTIQSALGPGGAERYITTMVIVEEIGSELEPSPKRHRGPNPTAPPLALTLPGEKMRFEEERREGTYCAFFNGLVPGVAHEIRKAAQKLNLAGNVAVIEHGYLVLNWKGQSSNLYSQLKDKLLKLNVGNDKAEGTAGKLMWIRPMKPYLKKRLETLMALVYPLDGTFWVHPPTKIDEEEKLETMKDWADEKRADLLGTAEDYVPFAEAFEELLGEYFPTDDHAMQNACVRIFGQCFPEMRTPWYKHKDNVDTQKAQEPIHDYRQIPPEVRVKVKGRMQPKDKDIEGVILEGACLECGDKIEAGAQYCVKADCLQMKKLSECNSCPECGSENIRKTKEIRDYVVCRGDDIQTRQGEFAGIQCTDCNCPIYSKAPTRPGVWFRGTKRKRPEEPAPAWATRKA